MFDPLNLAGGPNRDPMKPPAAAADGADGDSGLIFTQEDRQETGESAVPQPAAELIAGWLEGGMALLDAGGHITEINETLCAWLDQSAADAAGNLFWTLLASRCPAWDQPLQALRESAGTFSETSLRLTTTDSQPAQWVSLQLARHVTGSFVRINSILPPLSDLEEATWNEYLRTESAQREMFVRLLRGEAQLKSLTERWPGVIFSQRPDFSFRFISSKIETLTGIPVSDWQARPNLFWHVVHEGDADELRQQLKHARQTRQAVTSTYRVRHAQNGRVAYVMEHREPVLSRGGLLLGYEGVWLDVTRQTIAEKRLSSSAWKETLSVLTMGLAHDFGNVMAGIHALSESFLDQVGSDHEFREGLTLIKKNTQQASHLVHRIINLHQGKTGEDYYHNLNEIAADLAELVRKIIPRRMQFSVTLSPEALPVYLDAVELRQVVINLVLNAIDAMPEKGQLLLSTTGCATLPKITAFQGSLPRSPVACLSVRDTGTGIKPRHLGSIFDPFFTTKPLNRGSGLGLYNARLFVEKYRGAISVDSQEGQGSTFHLWLPQADFTEAEAPRVPDRSRQPKPCLLVAGPAGRTLEGTAEFLRGHGYQVVTASAAESAEEALASHEYSFGGLMLLAEREDDKLLILLPEARRRHPQLKVILKMANRDYNTMPAGLLRQVDLVIPPHLSQSGILEKLNRDL